MTPNRLGHETSPYLRQHASNPVAWYPWGDEAFAAAKERDVPVLLSVGYSACHWCHVMAHESFEDPATAAAMNGAFVNVKVDREERPDVDAIYMEAVQAVTGSGGWPMTVLLLPDGRPFLGGTYYPRAQFGDLIGRVAQAWREQRGELEAAAAQLADAVRQGTGLPSQGWAAAGDANAARSPNLLVRAAEGLLARFDPEWGGFGRAPKFPQPTMVELLLAAHVRTGRPDVLDAAVTTLDAMASGGIYDHLGGGFARYATDRRWLVPHFEKMLYDNALLTRLYLHAWQLTGAERYRQVVAETVGYLLEAPMRRPDGGFCAAEDADSEGEEGRFYVWDGAEVAEVGGPAALEWYGVTDGGNWEGHNILWRPERADLVRPDAVEAGRRALLAKRSERIRPGLDDKVLTEWNAMAVAALAESGATLDQPAWVDAAEATATFLLEHLRRPDGRWLRSLGSPHLAYAGDHAWLVEAFTRLAEATGRARWITEACAGADELLRLFWDDGAGGFFTVGADAEQLIARPKDTYDGAVPSANSVAVAALLRLGALTGEDRYRRHAEDTIAAMAPALGHAPVAFTGLVAAADLALAGTIEVAVTGARPDLLAVARRGFRPTQVLAWGEPYPSPLWEGRTDPSHDGLAFVCRNWACEAPVADPDALAARLGAPPP
ncbi:MAG: thioredoxin domain-containing protein [Acidimicrobiales bacterium]